MDSRVVIVIPARYEASRFPGKLLAEIHGRPVLEWVHRRALQIHGVDDVLIASDDDRIRRTAEGFGARVVMTRSDHRTGTDRIGEVLESFETPPDFVVNLQGDEPVFPIAPVAAMIEAMKADDDAIWTLAEPIGETEEAMRPTVVKVVIGRQDRALYFSRAPIPYDPRGEAADGNRVAFLRHVGIYGFPVGRLREFLTLDPSPLEQTEKLEQLRALESGIPIRVRVVETAGSPGIDVPEDLERLRLAYPNEGALESAGTDGLASP